MSIALPLPSSAAAESRRIIFLGRKEKREVTRVKNIIFPDTFKAELTEEERAEVKVERLKSKFVLLAVDFTLQTQKYEKERDRRNKKLP